MDTGRVGRGLYGARKVNLNVDHQAERKLITGTGGSGKSTEFLRQFVASNAPWKFLFDPELEFSRKLKVRPCLDLPSMAAVAARREIVCFDSTQCCATLEEGFDLFCRYVWNFSTGEHGVKLLGSDEVQDFTMTGNGGIPPPLKTILQKGRRQEINMLLIAHSLGELHDRARGALSHIVTFRHEDALALDWLKRNGFDPEAVKSLPYPGGWICRHRYTGQLTTNVKNGKLCKNGFAVPAGA